MENQVTKVGKNLPTIEKLTTGRKIRELKNLEPIKDQLRIVFALVGLKTIPSKTAPDEKTPSQADFLHNFIFENYQGLCENEISHAFKMAVQGLIKVDVNHYQNFSPEYFARVMQAYSKWRGEQLQRTMGTKTQAIESGTIDAVDFFERHLCKKYDLMVQGESYQFTEEEGAMLYFQLSLYKINMSNKEITARFAELAANVKARNRVEIENKKKPLRRELKAELFKNWVLEKVLEGTDIRDYVGKHLI